MIAAPCCLYVGTGDSLKWKCCPTGAVLLALPEAGDMPQVHVLHVTTACQRLTHLGGHFLLNLLLDCTHVHQQALHSCLCLHLGRNAGTQRPPNTRGKMRGQLHSAQHTRAMHATCQAADSRGRQARATVRASSTWQQIICMSATTAAKPCCACKCMHKQRGDADACEAMSYYAPVQPEHRPISSPPFGGSPQGWHSPCRPRPLLPASPHPPRPHALPACSSCPCSCCHQPQCLCAGHLQEGAQCRQEKVRVEGQRTACLVEQSMYACIIPIPCIGAFL